MNKTSVAKQAGVNGELLLLKGRRILLVEDNRLILAMTAEFLEETGAIVGVARNGAEAIYLLAHDNFDCILMDIQMPVMDGYEATRLIRADPALTAIPVIAMTVSDSKVDIELCLAAGINDFISKPFLPDVLYATIAKWLTGQSQQQPTVTASSVSAIETMLAGDQSDIDLLELIAWVGDDQQKIRKFLLDFLSAARESVVNIEAALERDDFGTMGALAHHIRGAAKMAGAVGFTNLCRALQESIRNSAPRKQAQAIVSQMRPLLDRIHERHIP